MINKILKIGKRGGEFVEIGFGWPPGGAGTIYYVKEPWKWPWKKDGKCD